MAAKVWIDIASKLVGREPGSSLSRVVGVFPSERSRR